MTRRDELTLNPETLRPPLILHGAELLKGKMHAHNRLWISDPKRGTGDRRGPWPALADPPTHPSTYCHNHTDQHAASSLREYGGGGGGGKEAEAQVGG